MPDEEIQLGQALQAVATKIAADAFRQPPELRFKAIKQGMSQIPEEARGAVEMLVYAGIDAAKASKDNIISLESSSSVDVRSESNGIIRTLASIVSALSAAYFSGFLNIEGTAAGLTIRGGGALAVFVFVFMFYPPTLLKQSGESANSKLTE